MMKEILLRIPDELFGIIKEFKEKTGVAYTNFIYNSIVWYCVSKKLLSFRFINGYNKKEEVVRDSLPEELKFCDGDSCEV